MWCLAMITTITLVTLFTSYSFVTNTDTSFSIALLTCGTNYIAFAWRTFDVWISPEIRLTFIASSSTKTCSALATSIEGITPVFKRLKRRVKNDRTNYLIVFHIRKIDHVLIRYAANSVTFARITTLTACDPPVIFFASVTTLTDHMRQARTLSSAMIARSKGSIGTQEITVTFFTILLKCITVKSRFANLTIRSIGIVETL